MITKRGLPKYVYSFGDKYRAFRYDGEKLYWVGEFDTMEEAHYAYLIAKNGHHWEGIVEGPFFGFTYIITHKRTGKRYVGKKQFFHWNGPTAGYKCHDMLDEWWDEKAWKPSGWETYTGSSIPLNREMAKEGVHMYKFEVLEMCRTKLDLHISELSFMIENNVLEAVDENGEYLWYNENIAGLEYRPPFKKSDVKTAREQSEEDMRVYYLKPDVCSSCKTVIPYGKSECSVCNPKVSLGTSGGGFEDVRKG